MSALATPPAVEMVGNLERHVMPNGGEVFYRDGDHSYWKGAKANPKAEGGFSGTGRLTGISTVVAPYDWRPDNLMRWAARLNGEGVAALAAEGLSQDDMEDMRACLQWLTTGESIWQALEDARLLYDQARDDAATRGTNVHKHALQAMATGSVVPSRADLTDEEWGYARGVMAFWHETEPEPMFAEQIVCDPDLGVAGRFDLVCELTFNGVRQLALVDAKTSGFIPVKHHSQLAGYRYCAEKCELLADPVDCMLILQVDAQGGYELVPAEADDGDFLAAVDLYRRAARIQRECNATRKAAA